MISNFVIQFMMSQHDFRTLLNTFPDLTGTGLFSLTAIE